MHEYEKDYIECRLFIIGDREVGKKSFIEKLLSIPSTSLLRNMEAEKEYNQKLCELLLETQQNEDELKGITNNKFSSTVYDSNFSKDFNRTRSDEMLKFYKTRKTFDVNRKFLDYNPFDLEEKKNKYMMKSFIQFQMLSSRYNRPPAPEHPSKLFNINKSKIIVKPYYFFPAEELPDYYTATDEDASDYVIEGNTKLSMKGINKDIEKKLNIKKTIIEMDKLIGFKIFVYNIFIFMYDLSNFSTFENITLYFDKLNQKFKVCNTEENCISCIIGNKKDKKINMEKEQEKTINEFFNKNKNLYNFEISTKPFFNFDKFFYDFFLETLSQYHESLFNEFNFKKNFGKIVLSKSNFSRALRTTVDPTKDNPGPGYDLNVYGYNTMKELNEAFNNKKKRFNTKIFSNKQGPIFYRSKSVKDLMDKEKNLLMPFLSQSKGGILNKSPRGYSLRIALGKLGLVKSRKNMIWERNKNLIDTLEGDCTLYKYNQEHKSKDEEYFDNVQNRKKNILSKRNQDNNSKIEKNLELNKNNLKALEAKNEEKKQFIMTKLHLYKSSSTPNFFASNLADESKTEQNFYRKRFCDIIYPKNKEYMTKYAQKRDIISKNKEYSETPGPNAYDIRTNLLNPKKGAYMLERRKLIEYPREDPQYPDFKDEFEIIKEKGEKRSAINTYYRPRFQAIVREIDPGPYRDQAIWKKWQKNKEKMENIGHIKEFLDYRKQKLNEHDENLIKINEEKKQIQEISRAILMKKGYEDPSLLKDINYSLVEESSPKYTIKGKMHTKITNYEDYGNGFLNDENENIQAIKYSQLNRPLPNLNYIRPKLPIFSFGKAQRFRGSQEYEGPSDLFKDGIFAPKTQEDFFIKEPFACLAKRSFIGKNAKDSPSPADYKIKSSFEIIAEQGEKISKNKIEIQIKEMIAMQKRKEREEKAKANLNKKSPKNLEKKDKKNTKDNKLILKFNDDEDEDHNN